MHHRQSGAAHVPIMLFLILLVLFLGALGFAYVTTDANTLLRADNINLRAEAKTAAGRVLLRDHYIEDVGQKIGLAGRYTGRPEVPAENYASTSLEGVVGVMNPAEIQRRIDDFGARVEVASTRGLDDLFTAVGAKFETLKQRIKDLEAERDRILADKAAVDASFAKAGGEHSRAAGEWRQTMEQTRSDFQADTNTKVSTINSLQENLRQAAEKFQSAAEAHTAERKTLQNEIGRLQGHNTALVAKDKLRHPADLADGKILSARSGIDTAFINLGRKDMLQAGTIFRVRNRGSEEIKAYATVTRVENDKAEVRLSEVKDPLGDAVREGDLLYNDLFTPGLTRVVYLMGDFRYPYNKPALKTLLERLGNKVVAKMGPGVDTVILGDNPINEEGDGFLEVKDTDEYKEAVFLGVEFAPLRKIRDLIKL